MLVGIGYNLSIALPQKGEGVSAVVDHHRWAGGGGQEHGG